MLQRWLASKPWQFRLMIGAEFNERTPTASVLPLPPVIALLVMVGVAAVPLESITLTPYETLPPPPLMVSLAITAPVEPSTVMPAFDGLPPELLPKTSKSPRVVGVV